MSNNAPRSCLAKALTVMLTVVFVAQFGMICYFNLTQIENHLGYDSSWDVLKASLMWKEKALHHGPWEETTNLQLDTPMTLASLLFGITGNLLLSFGLADILFVAAILGCVWGILSRMKTGTAARMLALNLIVCPYMTNGFFLYNDLGYFSCILSGAAYYSWRVLIVLLAVYEWIRIRQEGRMGILGGLTLAMSAWAGLSSGVYLMVVVYLPYIVFEIETAMIRNEWKQLVRKESVFAYLGCAATLMGKLACQFLLRFEVIDATRTWTSMEDFWANMGSVFQGLIKVVQALPETGENVNILSRTGLMRLCPIIILAGLLISIAYFARRVLKQPEAGGGIFLFLLNLVVFNLLVLGLFNERYGQNVFEERYLLSTFLLIILMSAVFFDSLDKRSVAGAVLTLAMACAVAGNDVQSDMIYLSTDNSSWQTKKIQALAESRQAGVVYFWGEKLALVGRNMRLSDLSRVYKEIPDGGGWYIHWGDYLYYDEHGEYTGPTLLVTEKGGELVWQDVLSQYTLMEELNEVDVYACDHNPIPW